MKSSFVAVLRRSGNSMVVTVPKEVAQLFQEGEELRVTVRNGEKE